jgi:hypothetical protein
MAIYVILQCCKCNSQKRLHLFSNSKNKYDINHHLCEHFDINYSYVCKFGFFSFGWSIILEVRVQCNKCNTKYNFGDITFNSDYYKHENHHTCCYNVFMINVEGYNYASTGKGLLLQEKQRELEKQSKKEQQEKKEKEEKRKNKIKEKNKIQKLTKMQQKEKKELDKLYRLNTDYIDLELNTLLLSLDNKINNELSYDIEESIDKRFNYTLLNSQEKKRYKD